jgi:hypothetical protein
VLGVALVTVLTAATAAQEPAWNPAAIRECDRGCLVGIIDAYMKAVIERDVTLVPRLAKDVRMTENTGVIDVGEGVLWRSRTEPASFKIYVADPVAGQVALQARLRVQGRDTLAAVRLKIDRRTILEIEQLQSGNVAPEALELLTTPRPILTEDIPPPQRVSRERMLWARQRVDAGVGEVDGRRVHRCSGARVHGFGGSWFRGSWFRGSLPFRPRRGRRVTWTRGARRWWGR